jgi:hypothetical protein
MSKLDANFYIDLSYFLKEITTSRNKHPVFKSYFRFTFKAPEKVVKTRANCGENRTSTLNKESSYRLFKLHPGLRKNTGVEVYGQVVISIDQ